MSNAALKYTLFFARSEKHESESCLTFWEIINDLGHISACETRTALICKRKRQGFKKFN